jgi:predicted Zn-dependent protease
VGLLFGYAWCLSQDGASPVENTASDAPSQTKKSPGVISTGMIVLVVGSMFVITITAFAFRHSLLGAWYANLGAVQQTRLELSRYDPKQAAGFMLDPIRQASLNELQPALNNFAKALAADPTNRTALQRRAEVALSVGDYAAALADTRRLWEAGYRDEVTRLLYGDALVANGDPAAAVSTVQGLTWAEPRLVGQAWARYWEKQDYRRAADAWQAVLWMDPQANGTTDPQDIRNWLQQAQDRLK